MSKNQNPWKRIYTRTLEVSFILSLLVLLSVFFSFKEFSNDFKLPDVKIGPDFEVFAPPITKHPINKPRPRIPSIPVEADEDDVIDEVTIDYGKLITQNIELDVPPPLEDDDIEYRFFQVSEKPDILKQVKPLYPDIARKANISGTVVITVLIGKTGSVEDVKVFKDIPMLTDAAIQAAWKCKFKPAKQRDKYVKVWMNVPFQFNLN